MKKFLLNAIVLSIVILPFNNSFLINKVFAVENCMGFYSPNNPFPCEEGCPDGGNCTWWAAYKRPDLIGVENGPAGQGWIDAARNYGYSIDTTVSNRVVGAIAVWSGHVAYVENVNSDGTITISEMNCGPIGTTALKNPVPSPVNIYSYAGTFLGFILRKGITIQNDYYTLGKFGDYHQLTSPGVYDPSSQNWYMRKKLLSGQIIDAGDRLPSSNNQSIPITNSDFDGDKVTDVALFHPENYTWEYRESQTEIVRNIQFGYSPAQPIFNSDFDGDGKTDFAIWDPVTHRVYFRFSATNTENNFLFNYPGVKMYGGADFDGDKLTDLVGIDSNYHWHIRYAKNGLGNSASDLDIGFGFSPAKPIVGADFDGDGKSDFVVWNPTDNRWYFRYSKTNTENNFAYGYSPAVPLLGDMDGGGRADLAIWDKTNNMWYWRSSETGQDGYASYGFSPAFPI